MRSFKRSTFVVHVGAHSLLGGRGERTARSRSVKFTSYYWELNRSAVCVLASTYHFRACQGRKSRNSDLE